MERLFDETFAADDSSTVSRNLWYGYAELYAAGEYGKQLVLDDRLMHTVMPIVQSDRSENASPAPTEINWYFYGQTTTTDAIGDTIRPNIMVRWRQGQFYVRCNISDANFALDMDAVISFESKLQLLLAQGA